LETSTDIVSDNQVQDLETNSVQCEGDNADTENVEIDEEINVGEEITETGNPNEFENEVGVNAYPEVIEESQEENEKENIEMDGILMMNHRYNLRPNRTPSNLHKFAFLSVNASIKKWGEKAKDAIRDELKMLVKEKVFEKVQ
jgi:hypothetical protein